MLFVLLLGWKYLSDFVEKCLSLVSFIFSSDLQMEVQGNRLLSVIICLVL